MCFVALIDPEIQHSEIVFHVTEKTSVSSLLKMKLAAAYSIKARSTYSGRFVKTDRSYPSKVIEGWGHLRIEVLGCEVSFSAEPPGMHIVFETGEISPDIADAIVREIAESAESFTGQKGKIVPLQ